MLMRELVPCSISKWKEWNFYIVVSCYMILISCRFISYRESISCISICSTTLPNLSDLESIGMHHLGPPETLASGIPNSTSRNPGPADSPRFLNEQDPTLQIVQFSLWLNIKEPVASQGRPFTSNDQHVQPIMVNNILEALMSPSRCRGSLIPPPPHIEQISTWQNYINL